MTSRDRVQILIVTLPYIRPDTPTWAGENAGSNFLATTNPDEARALYRQGSYHELERILAAYTKACAWFQGRRPNRARHLAGWYWPPVNPQANPRIAEQAIDDLTRLMKAALPDRIRVPGLYREQWKKDGTKFKAAGEDDSPIARGTHANEWMLRRRDDEIRQLAAKGWTQAAIADKHGLSQPRVAQILAETTAAA